ncbi:hypothetical protein NMY22_g9372 [Coprinellus aureogranulatus]|nr:hypothetical protein NMY22_g9372 [Coprinellus aureogranulatus]
MPSQGDRKRHNPPKAQIAKTTLGSEKVVETTLGTDAPTGLIYDAGWPTTAATAFADAIPTLTVTRTVTRILSGPSTSQTRPTPSASGTLKSKPEEAGLKTVIGAVAIVLPSLFLYQWHIRSLEKKAQRRFMRNLKIENGGG